MIWNALKNIKDRFSGTPQPGGQPEAVTPALAEAAAAGGMPDVKELEKKGLMREFFRRWKDPAFLRQIQAISQRMQADGVDTKDQAAVKAWIEKHASELAEAPAQPQGEKPKTFVKTGPDLGRNDPCHCGSGKKFKKCHGASL
jgi:hypothetical protein